MVGESRYYRLCSHLVVRIAAPSSFGAWAPETLWKGQSTGSIFLTAVLSADTTSSSSAGSRPKRARPDRFPVASGLEEFCVVQGNRLPRISRKSLGISSARPALWPNRG